MKTKFTTLVFGSLVAGALALSAGPVLARDGDGPNDAHHGSQSRDNHRPSSRPVGPVNPAVRHPNWGWGYPTAPLPVPTYPAAPVPGYGYPAYGYPVAGPAYNQDLYRQLDNAQRKKAYDAAHHASREQLADDNARIARIQRQLGMR